MAYCNKDLPILMLTGNELSQQTSERKIAKIKQEKILPSFIGIIFFLTRSQLFTFTVWVVLNGENEMICF